jgi:hypothetical protein
VLNEAVEDVGEALVLIGIADDIPLFCIPINVLDQAALSQNQPSALMSSIIN